MVETKALEVIVEQKPGVITWNFDQLKTALAEKMKEYEGLVYTEDTVPVAKQDIATLRKLKKSVSDKRIEIKKKCLEPYEVIEKQAAELTELLDKPIEEIAKQLEDYEKQRRKAVREEIEGYMADKYSVFPSEIAKKLMMQYDERWENVSTTKKAWKQSIDETCGRTMGDIAVLDEIEDEFKDKAMRIYSDHLVLSEAMAKVTELRKQKQEIMERERERIAAEERRKAEEELRKAQKAAQKPVEPVNPPKVTTPKPTIKNFLVEDVDDDEEVSGWIEGSMPEPVDAEDEKYYTLRIRATAEQIHKIKGYIAYTGAVYTEGLA